ncbi:MAG: L-seryl-tRNA(Sec) selenium transferase [Myxococcaceae bacterium]|nr:L-seryl-tRNA(Sec) selenium transferase [Myxococcaceae bacterium]
MRKREQLRGLPSIDELLTRPSLSDALSRHPRARVVAALRHAVHTARTRLLRGEPRPFEDSDVHEALAELSRPRLRPVLNATGVVLHTNLGRAPLADAAAERVREVARGYSNLEFDLDEGERGSRYAPVIDLLRELTGAESAVVVNNNAAAVLLVLAALCSGREAIVSRGELVEIGGGFRVPDVMRQSGAHLVEVGTTNRTRLSDYEEAITERTGLLVKVHKSNFAQVGFTEEVETAGLAGLASRRGVPLFEDLGSGSLYRLHSPGLTREPTVREVVKAGADVVTFSGDKLLGGPQAGVIVGREELVERIRRHPLNRALRVDKMTVAALEATLELYRDERYAEIPAVRLLEQTPGELRARAQRLQELLAACGVSVRVVETVSQVGGGAMPLAAPSSWACAIEEGDAAALQARLRSASVPIVARVHEDRLLLDVRCLPDTELEQVAASVASTLGPARDKGH